MSYLVLARKWRPTQFDEVVGQEHVARTLKNAIDQDRVAHAFLFAGPRGVGKTSTARILAKALNCKNGPTATPCDECVSCTEIAAGQAVDVFEIDGASNRGINEIRELRESVRYAPGRDRHRIYIIDEVHMLTTEAFNALLKTLEEPPPHAMFIFATTEPQKIPVTILSRCQRYDFKRIGQQEIVAHLRNLCEAEEIEVEHSALQIIARQAAGGMRDALSLLDQIISFAAGAITEAQVVEILGVANRRHLFDLSEAILAHDAGRALLVLDEVNRYGYDLQHFAGELVSHFRDLMVVSVVEDAEAVTDLTRTEIDAARAQVQGVEQSLLHRYFSVTAQGAQEMSQSSYPKLILEMTLVRLAQLEPLVGIDLLVDRLAALEGGELPPEPPVNPERGVGAASGAHSDSRPQTQTTSAPSAQTAPVEKASSPPASTPAPEPEPEPASEPPRAAELQAPPQPEPAPAQPTPSAQPEPVSEQPREAETAASAPAESAVALAPEPTPVAEQTPSRQPTPIEPVDPELFASLSPTERWKLVVDALRADEKPLAMTCEHAYVERFEEGRVELSFADSFMDLINEPGRIEQIQRVVCALLDDDWRVSLATRDTATPAEALNLAEEREEDVRRRRATLEDELRNNPVIRQAQQLFEVEDDEVRVQVQLFDSE